MNVIPKATARAFNKAVSNSENINQDGSINWNFVDADTYMDVQPTDDPLFYIHFNKLADAYCSANNINQNVEVQ
ncbi:MAG: hypothetical protein CMP53_07500 [Flavobacteriales bacterium]|jgi:hypothetical protein|nr:hypothetical protein [Flavobacteriales bacterium]|tara:strand:+ start:7129 stop:7350 length:222 start_codon:yes stop_codon:yes gene_type:complete